MASVEGSYDEHSRELWGWASMSCDRALSREARRIVETDLARRARELGVTIQEQCPLHPQHDHLLVHERLKQPATQWQWRCSDCGKVFKSEAYLDRHLEKKHHDLLPADGGTCLADYCDILGCPSYVRSLRLPPEGLARPKAKCRPAELDARRHLCQHLLEDCFFPGEHLDERRAAQSMYGHYCEPLSCAGLQRLRDGLDPHRRVEDGTTHGGGYQLLVAFVLVALALFYSGVLCWYGEHRSGTSSSGGRRVRSAAGRGRTRRRAGATWWAWLSGLETSAWED